MMMEHGEEYVDCNDERVLVEEEVNENVQDVDYLEESA